MKLISKIKFKSKVDDFIKTLVYVLGQCPFFQFVLAKVQISIVHFYVLSSAQVPQGTHVSVHIKTKQIR